MAIRGIGPGSAYELNRLTKDKASSEKGEARDGVRGDEVHLSDSARLRGAALSAAHDAPDTREDKVAQLKAQVQAGTYTPDARLTAEKLVGEELELWD